LARRVLNASSTTFAYGPGRDRTKRIDVTPAGVTSTYYAAGMSYERIDRNGAVSHKHSIGDFAVVTTTATTQSTEYLHRDHLGSVDVITNQTGAIAQQMSFDAWGKRREVNWQAMVSSAALTFNSTITTRGFTGHEMVDPVGLIHMNGRVYDAELGRFLSADPHIQDVTALM
jgi:RHS repeat-associated protein